MNDLNEMQIRQRFNVLTWAVGICIALILATLSLVVAQSYQLGQITGELAVLIGHVQLK